MKNAALCELAFWAWAMFLGVMMVWLLLLGWR